MPQANVHVRDAGEADLDALLEWWGSVHAEGVHVGPVAPPGRTSSSASG